MRWSEGQLVMLVSQDRKEFLVRLVRDGHLETHRGRVAHNDLIGRTPGGEVQSHLSYLFLALDPSLSDLIRKLKRITQIMYPKDVAYALMKLNVAPGDRVLEAGTGSGAMTLALARAVGQGGRVYSYEVREDVHILARKNLHAAGLAEQVVFYLRDIAAGVDERDVDALFLDLREPWLYLGQVALALREGGRFGAIVPTTNQVSDLVQGLESLHAFAKIEVEEVLVRPYKAVPTRLRPADRMIAHTGYLVFARKVSPEASGATYWQDRRRRKYEETRGLEGDESDEEAE